MNNVSSPWRTPWPWLAATALLVLILFVLYPVLNIFTASFGGGEGSGWNRLLNDTRGLTAIRNTLILASTVTLISIGLGVPLAYVTARFRFPAKAIIALLPLITLVIPEVITAQTWLMVLGNNGLITRLLRDVGVDLPSFYGWFGLITVLSFIYYTYVYVGTVAAISGFDVHLEEAAQSLGTSPARTRLKVLVPVILPSILSSALLVFTMVVGNFATSIILSSQIPLLSVVTYQAAITEGAGNPVMQSTYATLSVMIVMLILFFNRWVISRGRFEIAQGQGARPIPISGWQGVLFALFAATILIISLMPLTVILAGAFTEARGPVMQWGNWTLGNLERAFVRAPQPILNTLTYAGIATAIGICFSAVVSYLIIKKRNAITPWLDYLSSIPLALSGTVLGIGLIVSFNHGWYSLTGTATIIVLALVVRRLPLGMRNSQSTLHNIPNSIEEASISLGVSPLSTFFKVVLPMMAPAIGAAAVLTWTTSVAELSASILVYSGGRETLTIQVFRLIGSNLMAHASAYGLVLIAVILIPILVATTVFKVNIFASR